MKLLAALAVASLFLMAVPTTEAKAEVCVTYEDCSKKADNGFAFFCVQQNGHWTCMECESCGNDPLGRELAQVTT